MYIFRTITEQYCPFLEQNIALEKTIEGGKIKLECLNRHICKSRGVGCVNKLLNINQLVSKAD